MPSVWASLPTCTGPRRQEAATALPGHRGQGRCRGEGGGTGEEALPRGSLRFGVGVDSTRAASLDPEFQGAGETGYSSKSSLIKHRLNPGSGPSERPAVWLAEGRWHRAAEFPRVPRSGRGGWLHWNEPGLGSGREVTPSPPPPLSSSRLAWGLQKEAPSPHLSAHQGWGAAELSLPFPSQCSGNLIGSLVSRGVEPVLIGSAWGHLIGCPGANHI